MTKIQEFRNSGIQEFRKSRNREEKAAGGIAVEDLTEKEALIEELNAREETAKADDNLSVQQKKDKDKAKDIRKNLWRVWEQRKSVNYQGEALKMISLVIGKQRQLTGYVHSRWSISCENMQMPKGSYINRN